MVINKNQTPGKFIKLLFLICLIIITGFPATVEAAPAKQQETGPTYIVQSGDTLNEIALRFGVTTEEIIAANALDNPNALLIGQSIIIPGLEEITGVLTSEVLPLGASLTSYTRQNQLKLQDLVLLNQLTSPAEFIAGVSFILPIVEGQEQLTPIPPPQPGISTLETAIQSGVSPWILVTDNQVRATWDLLPGESLYTRLPPETNAEDRSDNLDITVNSLPIVQGETLIIKISTSNPMECSGSFNGDPLRFFSDDGKNYYSFHGIHAMAEPGVYSLQICTTGDDGEQAIFEQNVLLISGFYANQWVFIEDATYLDKEKIAQEDVYLQSFLDQATPDRLWEGRFQYPIDEPCPNGSFGLRRDYNDGQLFYYHTGLDFQVCASNLNIYAPAPGVVVVAEALFTKGNAVYIDHGWGVFSGYAHLEEILVEVGDVVQPGDLIGIIGDTGRSAGPHLHFEINVSGTPVNPQTWLDRSFP